MAAFKLPCLSLKKRRRQLSLPEFRWNSKSLRAWTNGKCLRPNTMKHCLVTKHADFEVSGQTVKTCLIKQLIQAAEQAWYACPHQTCLIHGCQNEQNIAHQTREQKECFKFLIECLMALKFYQTRPNTIKQHQTRCPNGKMFGHQTMFDGVWSPNISRLSRP